MSERPLFSIKLEKDYDLKSVDPKLVEKLQNLSNDDLGAFIKADHSWFEGRVAMYVLMERNHQLRKKVKELLHPEVEATPDWQPKHPVQNRLIVTLFGKQMTFHFTHTDLHKISTE